MIRGPRKAQELGAHNAFALPRSARGGFADTRRRNRRSGRQNYVNLLKRRLKILYDFAPLRKRAKIIHGQQLVPYFQVLADIVSILRGAAPDNSLAIRDNR